MLTLNTVEVTYSDVILILKGISIEVSKGKIVSMLGANGAGKTTTLRSISGLLFTQSGKVTHGSIHFEGHQIHNRRPVEIASLGITQVMEGRRLFANLTVEENLKLGNYLYGGDIKKNLDMVYSYFPKLKGISGIDSGYLSGGEQQMMVIGRGMMAHPKLMLLDEPSLGLAPLLVKEIYSIVQRLNDEEKTTILVVEQNARLALTIADYAYVIENGRLVLEGPAAELINNQNIKEFYLGLSTADSKKNYREVKHYRRKKNWMG